MKILAICGSPRKGNTEAMLRELVRGAEDAGAETELVILRKLNIKHCGGCKSCSKTGECHIKGDDMQALYARLMSADVLVFGSPNYFDNMSGLMKDFIDRTVPLYYVGERLKGKHVALVGVGGSTSEEAIAAMKAACNTHGMKVIAEISSVADMPNDVPKAKLDECFELGKKLARL